jgi:hypothetical protein
MDTADEINQKEIAEEKMINDAFQELLHVIEIKCWDSITAIDGSCKHITCVHEA